MSSWNEKSNLLSDIISFVWYIDWCLFGLCKWLCCWNTSKYYQMHLPVFESLLKKTWWTLFNISLDRNTQTCLDCSSAVALTNLKFHFRNRTSKLSSCCSASATLFGKLFSTLVLDMVIFTYFWHKIFSSHSFLFFDRLCGCFCSLHFAQKDINPTIKKISSEENNSPFYFCSATILKFCLAHRCPVIFLFLLLSQFLFKKLELPSRWCALLCSPLVSTGGNHIWLNLQ